MCRKHGERGARCEGRVEQIIGSGVPQHEPAGVARNVGPRLIFQLFVDLGISTLSSQKQEVELAFLFKRGCGDRKGNCERVSAVVFERRGISETRECGLEDATALK